MTMGIAEVGFLLLYHSLTGIVFALFLFFIAFNVLEATLPSLIAKIAAPDHKGTAMGVYSSSQFIGAFTGGVLGGWLHEHYSIGAVFGLAAGMAMVWFLLAASMQNPRYLSSYMVKVGQVNDIQAKQLVNELTSVRGVAEAVVVVEDGIAYLKVDLHALDREALRAFSVSAA